MERFGEIMNLHRVMQEATDERTREEAADNILRHILHNKAMYNFDHFVVLIRFICDGALRFAAKKNDPIRTRLVEEIIATYGLAHPGDN
jgi:hypothetical protein